MNFAAHNIDKKYSHFASDYRFLVESKLKCLVLFEMDAVGLISEPYRELLLFGAMVTYPEDSVCVCRFIIHSREDVQELNISTIFNDVRKMDRLKAIE